MAEPQPVLMPCGEQREMRRLDIGGRPGEKIAVQVSSVSPSTCDTNCPALVAGRAGFDRCFGLRCGAGAAEQAHHELRAADEVRDDGEHDAAEAEPQPATATTGRSTAVVLDVLALSTLSPAHGADVSRRPRV